MVPRPAPPHILQRIREEEREEDYLAERERQRQQEIKRQRRREQKDRKRQRKIQKQLREIEEEKRRKRLLEEQNREKENARKAKMRRQQQDTRGMRRGSPYHRRNNREVIIIDDQNENNARGRSRSRNSRASKNERRRSRSHSKNSRRNDTDRRSRRRSPSRGRDYNQRRRSRSRSENRISLTRNLWPEPMQNFQIAERNENFRFQNEARNGFPMRTPMRNQEFNRNERPERIPENRNFQPNFNDRNFNQNVMPAMPPAMQNTNFPVPKPKFDKMFNFDSKKRNYNTWKFRVEEYLRGYGLFEIATGLIQPTAQWRQQDVLDYNYKLDIARRMIHETLDDLTLESVRNLRKPWDILEKMSQMFEEKSDVRVLQLQSDLINLKYKDDTSMEEHIQNFERLIVKLESTAGPELIITEREKCLRLLATLPNSWSQVTGVLHVLNRNYADLTDALKTHERVLNRHKDSKTEKNEEPAETEALFTRDKFQKFKKFHSKIQNHDNSKTCWYCGRNNHVANDCNMKHRHNQERQRAKQGNYYKPDKKKFQSKNENANVATESKQEEDVHANSDLDEEETSWTFALHTEVCLNTNNQQSQIDWVLDSGCTHHMSNNINLFTSKIQTTDNKVTVGDGNIVDIEGIGCAKIRTKDQNGKPLTIAVEKCYYIPKLHRNLLSLSKLIEEGVKVDFNTDTKKAYLTNGKSTITAIKENGNNLYVVKGLEQTSKRQLAEANAVEAGLRL